MSKRKVRKGSAKTCQNGLKIYEYTFVISSLKGKEKVNCRCKSSQMACAV